MDAECTRLVNLLGTVEKNKLQRSAIAHWLGISDRKLRKMIEQCQLEGVPIISLDSGYWIAESQEKMTQYVRRERKRSDAIDNKCDALIFTEWFD